MGMSSSRDARCGPRTAAWSVPRLAEPAPAFSKTPGDPCANTSEKPRSGQDSAGTASFSNSVRKGLGGADLQDTRHGLCPTLPRDHGS